MAGPIRFGVTPWGRGFDRSLNAAAGGFYFPDSPRTEVFLNGKSLGRTNAPLPIAGGEVLTRRQSFLPWFERGAFDIVQPDATKCGGISEARRIAWLAYDHNIQFISHGWNTAVGLAADLHLAAAIPVAR